MFFMSDLPPAYSALTPEILRDPQALDGVLDGIGFGRLSIRHKSRSYLSTCGARVIKVSYYDDAYHHWSRYAARSPDDPHMPRYEAAILAPGRIGLYLLEYLGENALPETFRDFVVAKDLGDFATAWTRRDADAFRALYPSFCASLDRVYAAKPDWYASDLSRANVRMRGETPVILDPWC